MHDTGRARTPVQGEVPNPLNPRRAVPSTRAALGNERCRVERPELLDAGDGTRVACHAVQEGRIDPAGP